MNFDMKLRISDRVIADMIEQCKLTSAPEGIINLAHSNVEESESNYVPDTDQEDIEYVTES